MTQPIRPRSVDIRGNKLPKKKAPIYTKATTGTEKTKTKLRAKAEQAMGIRKSKRGVT